MPKMEAESLAQVLRLLADRLEENPDAVLAFLKGEVATKSAALKIPKTEAGNAHFNLIQFYQETGKSKDALETELKKYKVPELRKLAKQYTGAGKKGPAAKAPKKDLIHYLVGVATKGTSSADIFLST